jgi:DNA helicase-2/ATP-dependent DNA helicase PcrA
MVALYSARPDSGLIIKKKFTNLPSPFVIPYMDELNREQYLASRADTGMSLVLAGAGTGKTRTLVEKVRNVIRDLPMKPEHVVILTFSRRAAEELRERVAANSGLCSLEVTAGTFHSYCLDLLRRNAGVLMRSRGFSRFPAIIDDDERKTIIRELIHEDLRRYLGLPAGVVYDLMMNRDSLAEWKRKKLEEAGLIQELEILARRFRTIKLERNVIDYDDMMNFAITMIEENRAVRGDILSRNRYIFVDEFQDVSGDNMRLLKLILPDTGGNLFAVGDDWQSIYGFRGARIEYIVGMKKHFPETRVHRLTINYRSRTEIVSLSKRFIRKNRFRTRNRLRSGRGGGGRVRFHVVSSFDEEADAIREILASRDASMSAAVLYRNNWQGSCLREVLCSGENGIVGASFMTMHAAKGLEFDRVIIAGVCDGIIPDADNGIEEERRLLYVACTRARDELHIIAYLNDEGEVGRFGRELGIDKKY